MDEHNITRHFVVFVAQIYRGLGSVLQTKRLCLDRDNIVSEISKLSTEDKLLLTCTSTIFHSEKESVKTDILSGSQTNKNILAMLNVIPDTCTWIQGGNSVLTCAINALRKCQASSQGSNCRSSLCKCTTLFCQPNGCLLQISWYTL